MSSDPKPLAAADELIVRARKDRTRNRVRGGLASGAMALAGVQGMAACNDGGSGPEGEPAPQTPNVPAPNGGIGKGDWAQYEGERRTDMVVYRGDFFTERSSCTSRAGCADLDVVLKVFVRNVPGANLDAKRVGVVFRIPSWEQSSTAVGKYFATAGDLEEWHVRVRLKAWSDFPQVLVFNAWYQDGAGHTYYDDNQGEFHVAAVTDAGYNQVIRQSFCCIPEVTSLTVSGQSVQGSIAVSVADLDYDKQIELVYSTDGWKTLSTAGMGEGPNRWRYVRDLYAGFDLWQIDLDVAADTERFEYAIVYRHGVTNDAKTYEFWDNNGGYNYVVTTAGIHDLGGGSPRLR